MQIHFGREIFLKIFVSLIKRQNEEFKEPNTLKWNLCTSPCIIGHEHAMQNALRGIPFLIRRAYAAENIAASDKRLRNRAEGEIAHIFV